MAKKKTTEKALNIDNILFNCRDYLRAARNSGSFFEKRDMMLTLVFLRFIGEKYEDGIENLKQTLKEQGLDPEDENIRAAFFDDATFADGTYNLPPEARWSTIISTPAPQLNVALDTALQRLEEEDPQLKGCFVKGTFTARNLAANDIKKIVDEVNKISHKTFGEEKDLIGRVYEYFLKEFAVNATKEEGEFYTPHDVVQLIATMIEPYDGTLYDPCCGSGGMFIQSAELVKSKQGNLNGINVYGQEKEPATYRLAKMNLALRGISHNLGEEADSSFTHDLHKGLHFNYIMANPPFNLKGWYNDNLKNDGRWSDYQTPPESNANYAWILHILSHLKKTDGVAGFLLANGALNDSDTLEIRKELIQNDKIEASWKRYDLVILDECSTVCNEDVLKLFEKCNAEAYLLLGDIYQIEAIKFGNWFSFARYFVDKKSVYELSTPYRAKDKAILLDMWTCVREFDENLFERLQANGFISTLNESIFEKDDEEIILCLGYDGLYGVNNINRYMQKINPSKPIEWGNWTYKVGDKVLFNENRRFGNVLYNNLKGRILSIDKKTNEIVFQVLVDKVIDKRDALFSGIKLIDCECEGKSIVKFGVKKRIERDSDADYSEEIVPFQIAYAVSIHKAQGLEYESVKVVITEDVDERISHNIFYTAITRTTDRLKIYMSKETQNKLAEKFVKSNVGLQQAQLFAGHAGLKLKNKLSS